MRRPLAVGGLLVALGVVMAPAGAGAVAPGDRVNSRYIKACTRSDGAAGTQFCNGPWYFAIQGTYSWHSPSNGIVHAGSADCSEYDSTNTTGTEYEITVTYCGVVSNDTAHTQYAENASVKECDMSQSVISRCGNKGHYLRVNLHPDGSYIIQGG